MVKAQRRVDGLHEELANLTDHTMMAERGCHACSGPDRTRRGSRPNGWRWPNSQSDCPGGCCNLGSQKKSPTALALSLLLLSVGPLLWTKAGFPACLASPVRETVQTSGPVFGPTRGVPQRPTAGMMSLLPTETPGSCRRVPPVFRDSLSHWTTSWPQGTPCLECSVISFRGSPSTLSGSDDRRDHLLTPRSPACERVWL